MRFWLYQDSRIIGPLDREELAGCELDANAMVCEEGAGGERDGDWKTIDQVEGLSGLRAVEAVPAPFADHAAAADVLAATGSLPEPAPRFGLILPAERAGESPAAFFESILQQSRRRSDVLGPAKATIRDLTGQVSALLDRIESLEARQVELMAQLAAKPDPAAPLQLKLEKTESHIAQLGAELTKRDMEIELLRKQIDGLERDRLKAEDLERQKVELLPQLARSEVQIETLRKQVADLETKRTRMEELERQKGEMAPKLALSELQLDVLKRQLAGLEGERARVESLEKQRAELLPQLAKKDLQIEFLQRRVTEYEGQQAQLLRELASRDRSSTTEAMFLQRFAELERSKAELLEALNRASAPEAPPAAPAPEPVPEPPQASAPAAPIETAPLPSSSPAVEPEAPSASLPPEAPPAEAAAVSSPAADAPPARRDEPPAPAAESAPSPFQPAGSFKPAAAGAWPKARAFSSAQSWPKAAQAGKESAFGKAAKFPKAGSAVPSAWPTPGSLPQASPEPTFEPISPQPESPTPLPLKTPEPEPGLQIPSAALAPMPALAAAPEPAPVPIPTAAPAPVPTAAPAPVPTAAPAPVPTAAPAPMTAPADLVPSFAPPPIPAASGPDPGIPAPPMTMSYSSPSAPGPAQGSSLPEAPAGFGQPVPTPSGGLVIPAAPATADLASATDEVISRLAKQSAPTTASPKPEKRRSRGPVVAIAAVSLVALLGTLFLFFRNPKDIKLLVNMGAAPAAEEDVPAEAAPAPQAAAPTSAPAAPAAVQPEAPAPEAVADPLPLAIEAVKRFRLPAGETIEERLRALVPEGRTPVKEKWDAGAVDSSSYMVQYTVQPEAEVKEPLTYLFEVEMRQGVVQPKNPAARGLFKAAAAPAAPAARPRRKARARRPAQPRKAQAAKAPAPRPKAAPLLPLPTDDQLLPPADEGSFDSDVVQ